MQKWSGMSLISSRSCDKFCHIQTRISCLINVEREREGVILQQNMDLKQVKMWNHAKQKSKRHHRIQNSLHSFSFRLFHYTLQCISILHSHSTYIPTYILIIYMNSEYKYIDIWIPHYLPTILWSARVQTTPECIRLHIKLKLNVGTHRYIHFTFYWTTDIFGIGGYLPFIWW